MSPFLIPIVLFVMLFSIPIVAILTSHQQKMAKILHDGRSGQDAAEIAALRAEIRDLKELVHQQMLAFDSMNQPRELPSALDRLERVG